MTGQKPLTLHEDRLLPANRDARAIARRLYRSIGDLPIVSPHGHTDPQWFADNMPFPDPAQLLITPDHYVTRMLYSQGVALQRLGVKRRDGGDYERDGRKIWRLFAEHYRLFLGTPSRIWLDHVFAEVFGMEVELSPATADLYYDAVDEQLRRDDMRPRALLDRFDIEVIATTESALDPLVHHRKLASTPYAQRVITTFRPDDVVNPDREGFARNIDTLGELTGQDTTRWSGYLAALQERRRFFKAAGRNGDGSWAPDGQDGRPGSGRMRGALPQVPNGAVDGRRQGDVPRPDADRDGADEPGRWPGHADPRRRLARSQSPRP